MLKAYKYRLYPTRAQEETLQRAFGCARWAYNWALDQKNRHLAKAIADCGWSEFVSMLEYKSAWYGSELLHCGRFEPSSKMCSACGHTAPAMPLSVRSWACPECGEHHDRDVNAAKNILKFAVAGTAYGRGGDVRRANAERYVRVVAHANSYEASSSGL